MLIKSTLLGVVFMLTLAFADRTTASEEESAGGFDFQMPDEGTPVPPKQLPKKTTKLSKKRKAKATNKARKIKKTAKANQVSNRSLS
jgi:hypothetical protein